MGIVLQFIGYGWAVLGVVNIVMIPTEFTDSTRTMGVFINVLAFILPGFGLGGLGSLIAKKG